MLAQAEVEQGDQQIERLTGNHGLFHILELGFGLDIFAGHINHGDVFQKFATQQHREGHVATVFQGKFGFLGHVANAHGQTHHRTAIQIVGRGLTHPYMAYQRRFYLDLVVHFLMAQEEAHPVLAVALEDGDLLGADGGGGGTGIDPRLEGATLVELPERFRQQGLIGVVASKVVAGSRAAQSGLRAGDRIGQVNRRNVADLPAFRAALGNEPRELVLSVARGGRFGYLVMQ